MLVRRAHVESAGVKEVATRHSDRYMNTRCRVFVAKFASNSRLYTNRRRCMGKSDTGRAVINKSTKQAREGRQGANEASERHIYIPPIERVTPGPGDLPLSSAGLLSPRCSNMAARPLTPGGMVADSVSGVIQ